MQVVSKIFANKIKRIGIGQGRNSEVFLANDPQLNGLIVLKEIPLKNFPNPDQYFNEAKILYKNRHSCIVPVMYAGIDDSCIRIAMPYFKNGSIQDILNQHPLITKQVIKYAHQLLLGLHHVHVNGYIHYDIKPTNILINDEGSILLSDFGQAKPINILGVAKNPALYPYHFPPEAFLYSHATKQVDIYQVGLTLYRMCNGESFFSEQKPGSLEELREKTLNGTYPNRKKFLPHVPVRLKKIIRKCLKVNPLDRYQTAIELIDDLGQVDKLLDWEYHELNNGAQWLRKNENHKYVIEIINTDDKWFIDGKTIRLADGLERRKTSQCGGPFSTYNQAINFVSRIFSRLEGGS